VRPPPTEVLCDRSTANLAPKFRAAVEAVLADMGDAKIAESNRTFARQSFLFGFGRDYDDGRGVVTNAASNLTSWHGFSLAVDVVHRTKEWDAGDKWFRLLRDIAVGHGLSSGWDWHHQDKPHLQWGKCKDSPSDEARRLYADGGLQAVWLAVGAA
jgi:hypothetical protein